jgi:hypothetical protein
MTASRIEGPLPTPHRPSETSLSATMAGAVAIETRRFVGKAQVFRGFQDEGGLVVPAP